MSIVFENIIFVYHLIAETLVSYGFQIKSVVYSGGVIIWYAL